MQVSFKAVIFDTSHRVLLGRNPRGEWELLGGRAEPDDADPEDTLRREAMEEAGLQIEVGRLIDVWYYTVEGSRIAIASYAAHVTDSSRAEISDEHSELRFFALDELPALTLPDGYKRSIEIAGDSRQHLPPAGRRDRANPESTR